jgi:uncharacterized coiled-coil protein SlyX
MEKSTRKRKPNRIDKLEFRLEQLEIALMNLMSVIANQDDELPRFIDNMQRAEELTKSHDEIFSMMTNDEGAEA